MPFFRIVIALGLSLALAACVAPQTQALRAQTLATPAEALELKQVPFFPQADDHCGPAALATVLQASGAAITPEALVPQVYVPERKGSFAVEMLAAARRQGRLVYPVAENLAAVLAALEQGYPVLVLQNNGLKIYPLWHYAVVVGADRSRERFILRSGVTERLELSFSTFERTWARAGYFAALILDPATLPDSLDADQAIRQLAQLEKQGQAEAAQAGFWRAVLNWPEKKTAWVGLANASLALGDAARAESTYRELVRRSPQYGPGLNNLADLLLKQGRAAEALPLAERAVQVLDMDITRQTLRAAQEAVQAATQAPAAVK